jgi:hypothetical protein
VRERRRCVPLTEADEPADLPKVKRRSPWSEDSPSPRCVLRDAKEGALIFWPIVYWPLALPQLAVNMLAATLHVLTQRPARFWGTVAVLALILHYAH